MIWQSILAALYVIAAVACLHAHEAMYPSSSRLHAVLATVLGPIWLLLCGVVYVGAQVWQAIRRWTSA